MYYVGYQSDMEDIWDWVLHPYPEEDQVIPHTPEEDILRPNNAPTTYPHIR